MLGIIYIFLGDTSRAAFFTQFEAQLPSRRLYMRQERKYPYIKNMIESPNRH